MNPKNIDFETIEITKKLNNVSFSTVQDQTSPYTLIAAVVGGRYTLTEEVVCVLYNNLKILRLKETVMDKLISLPKNGPAWSLDTLKRSLVYIYPSFAPGDDVLVEAAVKQLLKDGRLVECHCNGDPVVTPLTKLVYFKITDT
jgi:hypothetical protein